MSLTPIKYEKRIHDMTYRDSRSGKGRTLSCAPHLHRELELVYFTEGECVAIADSARCTLRAGDVFLSFPNQVHSYIRTSGVEKYALFILKADLIPEFSEIFQTCIPETPVIAGAGNNPKLATLFDLLLSACKDAQHGDSYLEAQRRGYLLAIFSELLPQMKITKLTLGDSDTLRAIVAFCAQNYAENLSLSVLQERLHLNKYYISHLFNDKLKIRFNDYINALRVNEACRFLSNSEASITEISELVGFNTLRTFNRAFMKHMNTSPSEYRKNNASAKSIGKHPTIPEPPSVGDGADVQPIPRYRITHLK
ncbi:MAG: AraC family transcriptional regulator [Ruminococcaceae bacterium]|nr:AraC family transcriptional regulator [Oscillospiraceae bacterium]